jgi:hypothetical protein
MPVPMQPQIPMQQIQHPQRPPLTMQPMPPQQQMQQKMQLNGQREQNAPRASSFDSTAPNPSATFTPPGSASSGAGGGGAGVGGAVGGGGGGGGGAGGGRGEPVQKRSSSDAGPQKSVSAPNSPARSDGGKSDGSKSDGGKTGASKRSSWGVSLGITAWVVRRNVYPKP